MSPVPAIPCGGPLHQIEAESCLTVVERYGPEGQMFRTAAKNAIESPKTSERWPGAAYDYYLRRGIWGNVG